VVGGEDPPPDERGRDFVNRLEIHGFFRCARGRPQGLLLCSPGPAPVGVLVLRVVGPFPCSKE
jgi:hypothetical protein